MIIIYEKFKAEIVKVERLRGLTNADIGELTGYTKKTIDIKNAKSQYENMLDTWKRSTKQKQIRFN